MQSYEAGTYDVIVVGAGHAGSEAALAAARLGASTLLVTLNLDMVAYMPCNPSIGGPAKGVVVREIDALGGEMGRNIDKSSIQMRMLNTGKGPAVRALRAQADKNLYASEMKKTIEQQDGLDLRQGIVDELIIEDGVVKGVMTSTGAIYRAHSVVLTTGTAARGEIIIGELKYSAGPNNSQPSIKLSENLIELGFDLERFKTGTPPRVDGRTVNFDLTEIQPGDENPRNFSYDNEDKMLLEEQVPCWLTYTNEETHQLLRDNLDRAPMFSGIVDGVGARYCPSIEDKVVRFGDKNRHQVFIEPEGLNTDEYYVQGLSTSMPEDVQWAMVRSIPALKDAKIMRSGYAIEYDVVKPHQLWSSLETKAVKNLYTAGQTNGTSGYEEAAGQGLIAGINAARAVKGEEPLVLGRDEAYIGVMIDDLVTKGTTEPYRLLTSRAEYRLLLRHDNADSRLTPIGYEIGLVTEEYYQEYQVKQKRIENELERIKEVRLKPSTIGLAEFLEERQSAALKDGILIYDILKRPEITYSEITQFAPSDIDLGEEEAEEVQIRVKYDGYIKKANQKVERQQKLERKQLPEGIDYYAIDGLATEAKERLAFIEPETLGQASRISGVNPADISVLTVYLESGRAGVNAQK